jgi:hypothetical protein
MVTVFFDAWYKIHFDYLQEYRTINDDIMMLIDWFDDDLNKKIGWINQEKSPFH